MELNKILNNENLNNPEKSGKKKSHGSDNLQKTQNQTGPFASSGLNLHYKMFSNPTTPERQAAHEKEIIDTKSNTTDASKHVSGHIIPLEHLYQLVNAVIASKQSNKDFDRCNFLQGINVSNPGKTKIIIKGEDHNMRFYP